MKANRRVCIIEARSMPARTERWENPMRAEYTVVIEKDQDGYYVGSVPALPGCHTQGKSLDQLLERMQEAVALWLEVNGENAPSPVEWVGVQRISV